MFEKMIRSRKAWKEFCEWALNEFNYIFVGAYFLPKFDQSTQSRIDDRVILLIMPFYFDENGIDTDVVKCEGYYNYIIEKDNVFIDTESLFVTRQEALIKACEKAFEIREGQLNV